MEAEDLLSYSDRRFSMWHGYRLYHKGLHVEVPLNSQLLSTC